MSVSALKTAFSRSGPVLGLVLFFSLASAEPPRGRVLAQVAITEDTGCSVIRVEFNAPVRYVRHFPYDVGNELRIKLEPIGPAPNGKEALSRREAVVPAPHDFAGLLEVIYEGDMEGGPYLTMIFLRPVAFKVGQGSDFRSLTVAVPGPEASAPCLPTR